MLANNQKPATSQWFCSTNPSPPPAKNKQKEDRVTQYNMYRSILISVNSFNDFKLRASPHEILIRHFSFSAKYLNYYKRWLYLSNSLSVSNFNLPRL